MHRFLIINMFSALGQKLIRSGNERVLGATPHYTEMVFLGAASILFRPFVRVTHFFLSVDTSACAYDSIIEPHSFAIYTKVSMNFRSAVARATIHHKANHSTIFIFVLKTMQRERTWSIHILSFPLPLPHLNHLLRFDFLVYRRVSRDNSEKCRGRRKKENFRSELF